MQPSTSNLTMADKVYATNRKAWHDYHILESMEVGLVLQGTEVKSIRSGHATLRDAYARLENGELWLRNAHIAPYALGNRYNHETDRPRKLLAHRGELERLGRKAQQAGLTLVPLKLYDKKGHLKVELGVAKGKREYDKREALALREAQREIDRATKKIVRGR